MLRTSMLRGIGRLAYGEAREWEIREKRKEGFLADWRGSGRRWTQIFGLKPSLTGGMASAESFDPADLYA